MGIKDRKRREWEARHEAILDAARSILIAEGYQNLTMDRLGDAIEYSRGTIYQHFKNKQEVTGAVLLQAESRLGRLMEKGLSYQHEHPRIQILGTAVAYEIFFTLYPDDFGVLEVINFRQLKESLPADVSQGMDQLSHNVLTQLQNSINAAADKGELTFPDGYNAKMLILGLFTVAGSLFSMIHQKDPLLDYLKIDQPINMVRLNRQLFLDGLGWQPLSTRQDYRQAYREILTTVFKEELDKLPASFMP